MDFALAWLAQEMEMEMEMASPPRTHPCIQRCEAGNGGGGCLQRCFRLHHPDDDYEDHLCEEHEKDLDHNVDVNCSGMQVADTCVTITLKGHVRMIKDRTVLTLAWLGLALAWFALAWLWLWCFFLWGFGSGFLFSLFGFALALAVVFLIKL